MNCIYCNSELIWQSDFDTEDCDYDFEGIVSVYDCPNCYTTFDMVENFEDDTLFISIISNFVED